MKRIYLGLLGILLIGIVVAGADSLLNKEIIIIDPEINSTKIEGNITFNVDGDAKKLYNCYISESDGIIDEDDIIRCIKNMNITPNVSLSNICDWNDECLEEGKSIIGEYPVYNDTELGSLSK